MTPEQLETLREGWDFEAKLAAGRNGRGAVPRSLWETYSAMANTGGGQILLGARERDDGSLDFHGITDIDGLERDLWNLLENRQKVSANLLRREDVKRIDANGRLLLLIQIRKASRSERPVFINNSSERGTYLRVHEGDRRASQEMVRRMLADSVVDRDSSEIEELDADALDASSVGRYRELFSVRRRDHVFATGSNEDFLVSIGALQPNGKSKSLSPSWAGLWMLGKEAAIRRLQPHWHLSFKELPDDPNDPRRWMDRVYPDGTWNANLLEFYLRVIGKLHGGLKVPFELDQGQFRREETPAHAALREALVNTLLHADHKGTTGIRILKRNAGFEFINPGLMLITPEQLWRGGLSEARNPALQHLFALLGLGEREGSGGPTMRRIWREQHWQAPRIWQDMEHGETHLELPLDSLLPEQAVEKLVRRWGRRFKGQDELGRVILVTAEVEGSINHARIRELSDAHPHDITIKFGELVRRGLLSSSGRSRATTYALPRPIGAPGSAANDDSSADSDASSDASSASSGASGASSAASDTSSALSDTSSAASDTSSAASDISSAASDTSSADSDTSSAASDTSSALALARGRSRVSAEVLEQAILTVCSGTFLTTEAIAEQVKRAVSTLRVRFLPRMVREGRLVMRYPDTPSHPTQAYRTNPDVDGDQE